MYLNRVQLIGNLTREPELKTLPSGNSVVNFSIATNRTWKDSSGNKNEAVEFHNVTFYGKMADAIGQYCVKGQQLYIEGRIETRSWEKDGVKHYKTDIIGESFQFGQKPKNSTEVYRKPEGNKESDYKSKEIEYPNEDINPNDIPF
jgi:single-strand DNA-binding protein